jgi:hypothetical protein
LWLNWLAGKTGNASGSIRSERLLMEEMDYNLLFRWFVGLNADDEVWDATVFTKNRHRLLEADVAKEFLSRVVEQARTKGLTSDEHFTVDGTLLVPPPMSTTMLPPGAVTGRPAPMAAIIACSTRYCALSQFYPALKSTTSRVSRQAGLL